jgi:ribosomal protein L11 methyltransferase
MAYLSLRFDIPARDAEAWVDALLVAGALAVDVSDPRAGTPEETPLYGEPGDAGLELWPVSRLSALFDEATDALALTNAVAQSLGTPVPDCTAGVVAERDWVSATQSQFQPIHVAPRLWIVPTWCEPPDSSALNLRLDPGVAFGTGSHPTTRLCLAWLAASVRPGESVLDYGCGSGVLAIAAAMLGARPVVGTDVDPQAIAASVENARLNRADVAFVRPDDLPEARCDIVVANILANPLVMLAPALARRVRAGGRIALSGILETQAEAVRAAYSPWFMIAPTARAEGWVLLSGARDSAP